MNQFGISLKKHRLKKKLEAKQVADLVGVTFQTVYKWEDGKSYPREKQLKKLAEIFEVSVSKLLSNEDETPIEVPSGYVLIEKQTFEAQEREIEYLRKIAYCHCLCLLQRN